jgi:putative FmdB family regulatory protein
MPSYDYRCQECRQAFQVERSMNDPAVAQCDGCGSENVSRIWNAFIRSGGITPDVGQGTAKKTSGGGGGGCGSCSSHSCGTCH